MRKIRKLFHRKDWPKTDAEWENYDREKSLALEQIHDARARRGFGDFNLVDHIEKRRKHKASKKSRASTKDNATEAEDRPSSSGVLDDIEGNSTSYPTAALLTSAS